MDRLRVGSLPLLLLNLLHQLADLHLEALLELFLHLGVLFELVGSGRDGDLQLLSAVFTRAEAGLIL